MAGVLQVPTVEYLPFAFFNLINPLLAILFGLTGFRVERQQPAEPQAQEPASSP
jgi:NhaC family Na+:H+ antiporter